MRVFIICMCGESCVLGLLLSVFVLESMHLFADFLKPGRKPEQLYCGWLKGLECLCKSVAKEIQAPSLTGFPFLVLLLSKILGFVLFSAKEQLIQWWEASKTATANRRGPVGEGERKMWLSFGLEMKQTPQVIWWLYVMSRWPGNCLWTETLLAFPAPSEHAEFVLRGVFYNLFLIQACPLKGPPPHMHAHFFLVKKVVYSVSLIQFWLNK